VPQSKLRDQKREPILNAKNEPTLEDLGLDAPVEKQFGNVFDSFDSNSELPSNPLTSRTIPETRRKNSKFGLFSFLGFVFLILIGLAYYGSGGSARSGSSASVSTPTYADAIQVLLDDVDSQIRANVFGKASVDGRHLVVTLEDDYFSLDEKTKRYALTKIHETWVKDCYGNKSTFKSWDGKVVAEFSK